jgi:glutaredoxin/glutathione-dependent peroxiredoxin
MTIKEGDRLPEATLRVQGEDGGAKELSTTEFFAGRTVALFAVPGAFTRTCSAKHLPGFVNNAAAIKGKGVDEIACISVNDAAVMNAWGLAHGAPGKVVMLADGNADFASAIGMAMDRRTNGMGTRSCRYSMLVEDGVVRKLNVEPEGSYGASSAETMLEQL